MLKIRNTWSLLVPTQMNHFHGSLPRASFTCSRLVGRKTMCNCLSFWNICLHVFFCLTTISHFLSISSFIAFAQDEGSFFLCEFSTSCKDETFAFEFINLQQNKEKTNYIVSQWIALKNFHFSEPHLFSKSPKRDLTQQKWSLSLLQQQKQQLSCGSWL